MPFETTERTILEHLREGTHVDVFRDQFIIWEPGRFVEHEGVGCELHWKIGMGTSIVAAYVDLVAQGGQRIRFAREDGGE